MCCAYVSNGYKTLLNFTKQNTLPCYDLLYTNCSRHTCQHTIVYYDFESYRMIQ